MHSSHSGPRCAGVPNLEQQRQDAAGFTTRSDLSRSRHAVPALRHVSMNRHSLADLQLPSSSSHMPFPVLFALALGASLTLASVPLPPAQELYGPGQLNATF